MILDILTVLFAGKFVFDQLVDPMVQNHKSEEYMKRHHYDLSRQDAIKSMAISNPDLFKETYGLDVSPGRCRRECWWYLDEMVQQAVESEGLVYVKSYLSLLDDPEYCEIVGVKHKKR